MPNLLFIYTDEQRRDTLAAYGNERIEMPNLNRLAGESVVFDHAYVTQPVCTPSRASILTGLYPHTHGCTQNNIPLPAGVRCLPEMLTGDYATAHHGKWHLGDEIFAQHGFDEWRSIDDGYASYYAAGRDGRQRSTYHHFLLGKGQSPAGETFDRRQCARLPEELGKPAYLAAEASRFIRENRRRPFVLYVNFFEPHMPFFGPRDGQYDPAALPLPANFDCLPGDGEPLKTRLLQRGYFHSGHSGLPLRTEADWRRMIANYWGLCSLVDTHVGTILATLDDCGLRDDTIVVFTSDHGDMMGSHRLLAKCVQYEEAVQVPLLVRLPGQRGGRRIGGRVSQVDLVPTLLDLMGQEIPSELEGVSRRSLMERDGGPGVQDDVVIEWNGPDSGYLADKLKGPALPAELPAWMASLGGRQEIIDSITAPLRTIVTADGWKFTWSARGEHELYCLRSDPLETANLARQSESQPVIRDLTARIRRWQERTGDAIKIDG